MNILITKKQKLNYLKEFHQRITTYHNLDYVKSKENLISDLEWLIAHYEGRASDTPKQLLEVYINRRIPSDGFNNVHETIALLYNWVYYKKIVGF